EDVRHLIGEIEARFARDAHLLREPQLRLPRLAPRPKQLLLLAQDLGLRAEQLLASGRADLEPALRDLELLPRRGQELFLDFYASPLLDRSEERVRDDLPQLERLARDPRVDRTHVRTLGP